MDQVKNASAYPEFYYAKHLASGLAGYENETILIEPDALKEMMPSFIGKPIVVQHQDIELHNLEKKDGTVIESFYNELDGCAWVKMLIETDEARAAIAKGWSVSNCYLPTKSGSSGSHHNIPYDRKIENGIFKHLAIVHNPRYEEAKIYTVEEFNLYQKEKKDKLSILQNEVEDKKMFKIFKNTREEVKVIDEDSFIEVDGKQIPIKEMVNAVLAAEDAAKKQNDEKNLKVKVGDKEMSLTELHEKYNAMCKTNKKKGKKNEDDSDEDADDMENEEEDEKDKEKDKENALKNAREKAEQAAKDLENYNKLVNAASSQAAMRVANIESSSNKLERGKSRYGSGN